MKALFTLVLLLASVATFAQSKVEGVGPFKINKTKLADLPALAQSLGVKFDEVLPDTLDAIQRGKTGQTGAEGSFCPNTQKYETRRISIAGVTFSNVYLTFYRGKLVSFYSMTSPEIEQAFTEKYGSGKREKESTVALWNNEFINAVSRNDEVNYFFVSDSARATEEGKCSKSALEKIRAAVAKRNGNPLKDL